MDKSHFDEFNELLDVVSEQYGKPLSSGAKMLYWQGLKDFDFNAIQQALFRHIRNPDSGMFMPKIADVIKMLQGSTQDSAMTAWAKVDKAIRHKGPYVDVVFDDPLIHRVLHDMGGWIALGQKNEDEWPFVAKEFENRYRGFKQRSEIPEYPSVLVGIANAHNNNKGLPLEPFTMIGDSQACQRVLKNGTDKPLIGFKQADKSIGDLKLVPNEVKKLKKA